MTFHPRSDVFTDRLPRTTAEAPPARARPANNIHRAGGYRHDWQAGLRRAARYVRGLGALLATALGCVAALAAAPGPAAHPAAPAPSSPHPTTAEVLAATAPGDWRPLDPQQALQMELPAGNVLIELAPQFAPRHVANIRTMVRAGYFDGLAMLRSQDNYVAQWGDPDGETPAKARSLGDAERKLPAEFSIPLADVPLTKLPDRDGWAPVTGYVDGFPVAADPAQGKAWLAHCYGMVGAGRDTPPDSSNGAELYAVTGQSPRALDLNITLVGRVVQGMQWLSSLPRGTADLGFYKTAEERTPIKRVRLLADLPPAERPAIEVLRTDTPSWARYVESRRNRHDAWYVRPAGHVDLCSLAVPARAVAAATPH